MNVMLRLFAVAASLVAVVALPAGAAETAAQSPSARALQKPHRHVHTPGVVTAMRATKNADGTVSYECVEVARPARRMPDHKRSEETRQER